MRRRKALDMLIISLILIIIAVGSGLLITKLKTDRITNAVDSGQLLNMMIMVQDNENLLFSELFMYDSKTAKGALFDIPGNMGSIIDILKKMDRIDVLFDESNPLSFVEKVSSILNTEIPYYILIDVKDLANIIDLFDGIKIFIANPVELLDKDNLVLLPSGNLTLDGSKALSYMEYDDNAGAGVENISSRQKTLQALFIQIGDNANLLQRKVFTSYLGSYVRTNLKKDALNSFFQIFSKLDTERIVFQRVLGNTRLVGDKNLLFPHYEGKLLRETIQQTILSLATTGVASADELNVTMEILNATGQSGLANRTSQVFKSFGYDVVRVANFNKDIMEKTVIVSRNGDRVSAEKVAGIIRCQDISYEVENYLEDNSEINNSEIIVILGKDFDGRYCKE